MVVDVLHGLHPEYALEIPGQRADVANQKMDVIEAELHRGFSTKINAARKRKRRHECILDRHPRRRRGRPGPAPGRNLQDNFQFGPAIVR
ncbi:MAG TPA: hypothetical protein DDZ83_05815 [Nitrospinae bacterium]|nr:hypothetical protein [Nitrospinota bacterium]